MMICSIRKYTFSVSLMCVILLFTLTQGYAEPLPIPNVSLSIGGAVDSPSRALTALQLIFVLTVLSLAPAILLLLTSFTRIVVVLSLLRHALGTQQIPPNQIIIGLSLFLTLFIMTPVWNQVYNDALRPYFNEEITGQEAMSKATPPIKSFMLKQTREKDLALFVRIAQEKRPSKPEDLPLNVIIPAFVISELKTAFQIGFLIYLPFFIIDMFVASILLSMGMMMLPPIMLSLPFKLLLFVLVDGWNLVVGSLVSSFH
ncbi:MAG: flagellar type III secretion system pore protein FliP [Syntrophales bacterium]|nr:flagellar type III secretion system pore protein FliP [Syntrophales bacterium]